ncbi:MAG: STAS domain-containing protein [Acidobacteriota bacterium]|nr:STAS domain-containing protein [Acidobacteriota bacterium]
MTDAAFSFSTRPGKAEGTIILKLNGPLTLSNMFTFQNEFRSLKPACLIVDMTDVPYMDSAGLGLLMNAFVLAQDEHRRFLVAGVNARIMALLEMTHTDQVLALYPTVDEAEAS